MAFQLLALTGMWASCVSLFNGDKGRKTQSELETKRRETQLEMEYLRMNHQANLEGVLKAYCMINFRNLLVEDLKNHK